MASGGDTPDPNKGSLAAKNLKKTAGKKPPKEAAPKGKAPAKKKK